MKSDWGSRHACEGSASEPPAEEDEKILYKADRERCTLPSHVTIMDDIIYSWHDDFLNVVEDTLPVLRLCGRCVGEKLLHVTWLHIWNHPSLPDGAQVLCDVVDQLLT